jgi:hypothetical protein
VDGNLIATRIDKYDGKEYVPIAVEGFDGLHDMIGPHDSLRACGIAGGT